MHDISYHLQANYCQLLPIIALQQYGKVTPFAMPELKATSLPKRLHCGWFRSTRVPKNLKMERKYHKTKSEKEIEQFDFKV